VTAARGEYDREGGPMEGLKWASVPFSIVVTGANLIPPNSVLIDGIANYGFVPRTMSIGSTRAAGTDETAARPEPLPLGPVGDIPIELRGLYRQGGFWLRRFLLRPFARPEIDISSFVDLRAAVLGVSGAPGFSLYATVTNRPIASAGTRETVWWGETYADPGTFAVPPGADRVTAAVADPGFSWSIGNVAGVSTAVPDPLVAGVDRDAKGGRFTTTVPGLFLSWRIRL
jgi:hypothetical protein